MTETFDLEVKMMGDSLVLHIPKRLKAKTGLKTGDIVRTSFQKMQLVPIIYESEKEKKEIPPRRKQPVTFQGSGVVVKRRAGVKQEVA